MSGGAINFTIDAAPVAKGRPRISTRGGTVRAYTPAPTVAFERVVSKAAQAKCEAPYDGPVALETVFELVVPKSWSKRDRELALSNAIAPVSRPDLDNYVKAVADALNGIAYVDDSQIVTSIASKRYAERAAVHITVRPA